MTAIKEIRNQLPTIQRFGPGLVGVFGESIGAMDSSVLVCSKAETDNSSSSIVGGTSGIGESTAREFVRYAVSPRVYLIGRSQEAATRIQREFQELKSSSEVRFIKADVSQLRSVDDVCQQITAQETKINLLFLSAGIFHYRGREGM
jgi:short-subunit dehydrogenase